MFQSFAFGDIMERASLDKDGLTVKVGFSDGDTGEYPYVWLRDNCQCSTCFHPVSKSRLFLLRHLDIDVEPTKIQVIKTMSSELTSHLTVVFHKARYIELTSFVCFGLWLGRAN